MTQLKLYAPGKNLDRTIQVAGFDLDGVLSDAEPFKFLAYKMVMLRHGVPLDLLEDGEFLRLYAEKCIGKTGEENAQAQLDWAKERGFDLGITAKDHRDERMPMYKPLEGFIPLIGKHVEPVKWIGENSDCLMYLISRTDEKRSREAMARAGIEDCFTYRNVVGKGQAKYGAFAEDIQAQGISFENCMCIEDTEQGISDIPEGMLRIAVPNYFTRNQDFSKADFVVA